MMKKILLLFLSAVLMMSSGCLATDDNGANDSNESSSEGTTSEITDSTTADKDTSLSGDSGNSGTETEEPDNSLSEFTFLSYPEETVKTLEARGISLDSYIYRVTSASADYSGNRGQSDGSGIVISPYYELKVNGISVPVYAVQVYIGSGTGKGALHSFAVIETKDENPVFEIEASPMLDSLSNAVILPASLNITPELSDGTVKMSVDKLGEYTLLINGADQQNALTVFVRQSRDEEKEIADYTDLYGEENVLVFDAGIHELDYINIPSDNYVIYLRTGALLLANHKFDINSESDSSGVTEDGINGQIGTGAKRFPFINCHNKTNINIIGNGTIDLTALDWHERNGIFITMTNDVTVDGPIIVNAANWSFTTYRCNNVSVKDLVIFGYRTNSDGINICNSTNVTVDNCFARSGDDLFGVKTLGGPAGAVCSNVLFTDCIAWAGKARCFGVVGEVNHPIYDVTFRDCATIYRDATWDNDRVGGLAVVVEQQGAEISDILFENIEIFRDTGRAINCCFYNNDLSGCSVTDVTFKNVVYNSNMTSQFKSRGKNTIEAVLDGVYANGTLITNDNISNFVWQNSDVVLEIR